jgi:hypothetical protein
MIARVVADLRAEGRAERGLRPGDVIRRAGDREVASRAALARPLEAVQAAGQGAIAFKAIARWPGSASSACRCARPERPKGSGDAGHPQRWPTFTRAMRPVRLTGHGLFRRYLVR